MPLIAASAILGSTRPNVVVLTGAGISTDSGIQDFRGPQGLWTKNPLAEKLSNIHYYLADREVRKAAWKNRMASPAWTRSPTPGISPCIWKEDASSTRSSRRTSTSFTSRPGTSRQGDRGARLDAPLHVLGLRCAGR